MTSNSPQTASNRTKLPVWIRLWPLYLIAGGLIAAWLLGLFDFLSLETLRNRQEELQAFVASNFALAVLAYLGVYAASTFFMIPGALWITIAGGLLFGLLGGTILTVIGATLGASMLFLAARTSFGESLKKVAGGYVEKIRDEFHQSPLSYMFAMRFIPAMPFPVSNIAPALLGAKFRDYVLTTSLGIVPGVLAYTWIGAGLGTTFSNGEDPDFGSVVQNLLPAVIALLLVSLLPIVWKKIHRKKPSQSDANT